MQDRIILIREVYKRKGLWLRNHPEYGQPAMREQFWNEIAEVCEIPREDARKKWKNLKDAFRKELKRVQESCDADGNPRYESAWPFYRIMQFIKDQLIPRTRPSVTDVLDPSLLDDDSDLLPMVSMVPQPTKPSGKTNYNPKTNSKNTSSINTFNTATSKFIPIACKEPVVQPMGGGTMTLVLCPPIAPTTTKPNVSTSSPKPVVVHVNGSRKRKRDNEVVVRQSPPQQHQTSLTPVVVRAVQQDSNSQNQVYRGFDTGTQSVTSLSSPSSSSETPEQKDGDDYHFFMSLIPHVKDFGTIQKLRLRNKIQELILEESGSNSNNNTCCKCGLPSPSP